MKNEVDSERRTLEVLEGTRTHTQQLMPSTAGSMYNTILGNRVREFCHTYMHRLFSARRALCEERGFAQFIAADRNSRSSLFETVATLCVLDRERYIVAEKSLDDRRCLREMFDPKTGS